MTRTLRRRVVAAMSAVGALFFAQAVKAGTSAAWMASMAGYIVMRNWLSPTPR